jgi:nucleoside-diphosphate-sugar epimerase
MARGHPGVIYILGGRGRLGQALSALYEPTEFVCLARADYEAWPTAGADAVRSYFSQVKSAPSVIYVCSGLLDPRLSDEALLAVNYHLPRTVIEGVEGLGTKVVTFGTAMEHGLTDNRYVKSKVRLGEFVEQANAAGARATHVRIHTQYGEGEPSSFMFLGQILTALRSDTAFAMTLGKQLREYHHVEDDARAIDALVSSDVVGPVDLAHGRPVTLRSLAQAVFESQGKTHLLQVGAVPEPAQDNFDRVFSVPESLKTHSFRDTLPAVVEYVKSRMNG